MGIVYEIMCYCHHIRCVCSLVTELITAVSERFRAQAQCSTNTAGSVQPGKTMVVGNCTESETDCK